MEDHPIKHACNLITVTFQENNISLGIGLEACATIIIFDAIADNLCNEEFKMLCDLMYQKFLMYKSIREEEK